MSLKYSIFYREINIKQLICVAGKTIPIDNIKGKESSPQAWG